MALLWFDGFDDYGLDENNMLDGAYAQVVSSAGNTELSTTNPATGTTCWIFRMSNSTGARGIRKVLPSTHQTIGIAGRFMLDAIPSASDRAILWNIRDSGNSNLVTLRIQADGQISMRNGGEAGAELANSGDFKLTAGIYQHIEAKVFLSATVGTIEVRVDGITRISATGLAISASPAGQVWLGGAGFVTHPIARCDDFVLWDIAGSENNDFLGPKSVFLQMPDQDTAQADMTPVGSATSYGAVNQTTPDGDTSYLESATPGDVTELDLADLPPEVTSISGIMLFDRSRKTDEGDGNVQKSLISGASVAAGADNPIATQYGFRYDIFEVDPATGSAMTPSAFNAAQIRLERTA